MIRFNKLSTEVIEKIVHRIVDETNAQLKDKNIVLELDDNTINYFVEEGYEPTMGARPLKRLFESELKKPLSKKILFEDLRNVQILVQRKEEELNFEDIKEI